MSKSKSKSKNPKARKLTVRESWSAGLDDLPDETLADLLRRISPKQVKLLADEREQNRR